MEAFFSQIRIFYTFSRWVVTRSGTEVFSGVYIDCTSSHPKWQQEILQKPSLAEHVSFGYLGVRFFFAIKLQQLREVAYLARGTFLPRAIICQIMATPGSVNCHSSAKNHEPSLHLQAPAWRSYNSCSPSFFSLPYFDPWMLQLHCMFQDYILCYFI